MAVYTYQAMKSGEPRSRPLRGTVTADSPRHARDQLRERRLEVLEVSPLGASGAMGLLGRLLHLGSETPHPPQRETSEQATGAANSQGEGGGHFRVRGWGRYEAQLVPFVRELSTLLAVGTPMVEALDVALRQQSGGRGAFGRTLLQVRDLVAAGVPLSQAMGDHPQVFDVLTRRLVDVGERAGNLDEVLERLAQFKERSQSFRGRIGNALIYPAIVLTMAMLVTLLLMTLVVPNILEPLIQSGRPLPGPTVVVKALSDFVIAWWWLLGIAGAGSIVGVGVALRTRRGRRWRDLIVLRLPGVGPVVRKQETVKVATVIATLMKSGIPFLDAVQVARGTAKNLLVQDALDAIHTGVSSGGDIADAVEQTRIFPPTVVQVFALGQASGRLEEMLERLATDYDKQVQSAAQRLAALMEPALILVMAALVGFIAFATILPILEAGQVL